MAAMNIFSQAVDSELVEEFLPVASPETRRAIQQLLSCKKKSHPGDFFILVTTYHPGRRRCTV
jgi:hypothetical protein